MKKSTISKLKSIFGSKKGKRQHQQQPSRKSSRSPSPEPAGEASPNNDDFRPLTPPPTRAGPPPSPPVPTHPIAPVAPEPSGPLPLLPCQVCGRTFVPQSLAKHVKICEKMTIKKRKTFDSSRQRREGTDLEQYLPKNFGLPENSPFLEKSPPPTAKPAPKPKVQSVRNAITKPMAELQKCPHCNRAFGVRAFERHVEWCADKAKILPAAPAQPPPHIADAKQRLNARTQYKAPPVRGRKSSQTRDKSSNSRSASVESSRGISPPREFGDHRQTRTRASESASSNDCNEEASPHVPVIRNTRNSLNSSSGDANVKARQARLARDISSSRNTKDSRPSGVQQSNTDPNLKKTESQNKQKSKLNVKKQKQLKKIEELAQKYNERIEKQEKTKTILKKREKSLIPIPRKNEDKNTTEQDEDSLDNINDLELVAKEIKNCVPINNNVKNIKEHKSDSKKITVARPPKKQSRESKSCKLETKKIIPETPRDNPAPIKETRKESSNKDKRNKSKHKETKKIMKESSMSLDSLEEAPLESEKKCQSIGINTELLCVPCVIHDNVDQKLSARKSKKKYKTDADKLEPKIELLYKNPVIVSSCETQSREKYESTDSKENLSIFDSSMVASSNSGNFITDNIEPPVLKIEYDQSSNIPRNLPSKTLIDNFSNDDIDNGETKSNQALKSEDEIDLSAEIFDENYENDVSNEDMLNYSVDHKSDVEQNHNDIECRYGSGETYTKFTEDPADLDEFINLTDKMMINHNFEGERFEIYNNISNMHTPKTNSLEAINKDDETNIELQQPQFNFSDTFTELKNNLKALLDTAGDDVKNTLKEPDVAPKSNVKDDDDSIKVCDMEHITVYGLKVYERKSLAQKKASSDVQQIPVTPKEFKLPSIDENNKPERKSACNKNSIQRIYKPNRKYKMLAEQKRKTKDNQTFIVNSDDNSDCQSVYSEAPPLKLPRIENKATRLDDNYDPFVSAARQMKELMSSDTNIPKKLSTSTKDLNRTLPILRTTKEKSLPSFNNNTKMMKDTLNKSYQKTPTLQRMKSFGSTNNDNNNTFGGRCSSFRVNRNDNKKSSQKLNTTFTKSSKENISTLDNNKSYFNRNNNLNRSFSSYTASSYSTPKPKDKIPKIATSLYHSFQRTTIKQPVKLDKIKRDDGKKNFVNLDSILADDNSSMTDSSYIDPRLINENDNLPINVNTILNNPDIISSMESLLTTENLPAKFESFSSSNLNNNIKNRNGITNSNHKIDKLENNNNVNNITAPIIDDLSTQYNKIMSSLEQSIASKTSVRDDESLGEDFDLEEFMTSFDEEIIKHKLENKRTCSSTTRVVKQSELTDSNKSSAFNSVSSTPKLANGMIPVNKSMSLNFSSNNIVNENLFPSSVKRSTSLLDSIQKKSAPKVETTRSRHKTDQLEQDLMQSLKDFDKFYASEKNETNHSTRETGKYSSTTLVYNGTTKRDPRMKPERKTKKEENVLNGNYTPNGKLSNDSAYSSLNRISPSKLSLCATKEPNGLPSLEQIPAGSDSSSHKDDGRFRSGESSSEEFLAMERSAELNEPLPKPDIHPPFKELDSHAVNHTEKRASSRASSRRSPTWRRAGELSSSGSEVSLHRGRRDSATSAAPAALPRFSRFCHECGTKFSVDTAKFCIECGVKRLLL